MLEEIAQDEEMATERMKFISVCSTQNRRTSMGDLKKIRLTKTVTGAG
jgi:hypothetical protein